MARKMGITTWPDNRRLGLAMALGGAEVRPVDITAAYTVLANNGLRIPPVAITKIVDADGNTVEEYKVPQGEQVVDPRYAYMITSILSDNNNRLITYGPNSMLNMPRPAAAKTGTTDNYRDTWTMGYTPNLTVGVWVGNSDNRPMKEVLSSMSAGKIWRESMDTAIDFLQLPAEEFQRPPGLVDAYTCSGPTCRPEIFPSESVPRGARIVQTSGQPVPTVVATQEAPAGPAAAGRPGPRRQAAGAGGRGHAGAGPERPLPRRADRGAAADARPAAPGDGATGRAPRQRSSRPSRRPGLRRSRLRRSSRRPEPGQQVPATGPASRPSRRRRSRPRSRSNQPAQAPAIAAAATRLRRRPQAPDPTSRRPLHPPQPRPVIRPRTAARGSETAGAADAPLVTSAVHHPQVALVPLARDLAGLGGVLHGAVRLVGVRAAREPAPRAERVEVREVPRERAPARSSRPRASGRPACRPRTSPSSQEQQRRGGRRVPAAPVRAAHGPDHLESIPEQRVHQRRLPDAAVAREDGDLCPGAAPEARPGRPRSRPRCRRSAGQAARRCSRPAARPPGRTCSGRESGGCRRTGRSPGSGRPASGGTAAARRPPRSPRRRRWRPAPPPRARTRSAASGPRGSGPAGSVAARSRRPRAARPAPPGSGPGRQPRRRPAAGAARG